jgi:hypothetical protein
MYVIRQINNPLMILAYGQTTEPGRLCPFDPTIYEEVELDQLPPDAQIIPLKTPKDKLNDLFNQLPPDKKAAFYPLKTTVFHALQDGDAPTAVMLVQAAPVPTEYQPIQAQIIAILQTIPPGSTGGA